MFLSFTHPTSPVEAEGILVGGRGHERDEEEGGGEKREGGECIRGGIR